MLSVWDQKCGWSRDTNKFKTILKERLDFWATETSDYFLSKSIETLPEWSQRFWKLTEVLSNDNKTSTQSLQFPVSFDIIHSNGALSDESFRTRDEYERFLNKTSSSLNVNGIWIVICYNEPKLFAEFLKRGNQMFGEDNNQQEHHSDTIVEFGSPGIFQCRSKIKDVQEYMQQEVPLRIATTSAPYNMTTERIFPFAWFESHVQNSPGLQIICDIPLDMYTSMSRQSPRKHIAEDAQNLFSWYRLVVVTKNK